MNEHEIALKYGVKVTHTSHGWDAANRKGALLAMHHHTLESLAEALEKHATFEGLFLLAQLANKGK